MTDRPMSQTQCDLLWVLYRTNKRLTTGELCVATGYSTKRVAQALYGLYCREFVREDRLNHWYPSPVCVQLWGVASGQGDGTDEIPV